MNLRALLELMRISNLPTVWSNVIVGTWAGYLVSSAQGNGEYNPAHVGVYADGLLARPAWLWLAPLPFIVMISLLYCGGMVLNDYWDREIDARERPDRPIPSGRVRPELARAFAMGMIVTAMLFPALALLTGLSGLQPGAAFTQIMRLAVPSCATALLVTCIVAYNRLHSGNPASVWLMACCRVLAVVIPALFAAPWPVDVLWWVYIAGPALTIGLYTLAISIVARREVDPGRGGFGGPKTIMNMIAAMPLLDAAWLVGMGLWPASLVCVACAMLTKLGHRRIAGS
jgi:4-hydroxybenzoate polyprenyltransferase